MTKLRIIATSDIHGYIHPSDYREKGAHAPLGLSRIATAIKDYRDKGPVLLLDNGDAFQGSPLLMYYHDHPNRYNNPIAQAFNYLNYDYINLGNHDFNYGPARLETFIKENNAPLLTSNIKINGEVVGQSEIIEIENKKIALIGVTTHYIPNWERPDHIRHMSFADAYESMKSEVFRLKDSVDIVIGMYHGGFEKDLETGEPTETLTGENQGYLMADIEGLDILITGHQHRSIAGFLHGTAVTQTAFKAQEFALIELDLETKEIKPQLIDAGHYEPDTELLKHFSDLEAATQVWLDQEIGYLCDGDLLIEDEFAARKQKHPLISLLNQIQMDKTGSQLSSNAMFNQAKGFSQRITMRDLVNTYPYPNTLVKKEIDGKNLKLMLERTAEYFTLDAQGNIAIAENYFTPKPQHYNYDMFDGIDYTIDVAQPIGKRIVALTYQGKPVQDEDTFTITVNNYRASGGGKYEMVKEAKTLESYQEDMVEIMMDYFKRHPQVKVDHKNNITLINSNKK